MIATFHLKVTLAFSAGIVLAASTLSYVFAYHVDELDIIAHSHWVLFKFHFVFSVICSLISATTFLIPLCIPLCFDRAPYDAPSSASLYFAAAIGIAVALVQQCIPRLVELPFSPLSWLLCPPLLASAVFIRFESE